MSDRSLANRVAIVTGAGRGLGRAMALGLARAGARVVATAAREWAEVEATAAEGRTALGADLISPMVADVTQETDAQRVVATALERFGRLDILVNNAGRGMKYVSEHFMTEPTRFWEVAPSIWRLVIDTNVNGPFLMARAATPHLLAAGWGRIINITMNRATMRRAGFSPYGPSKAALEIGDSHLVGGSLRHGDHRQCNPAWRRGVDRHDPRCLSGSGARLAPQPRDHGAAAALAGVAAGRWRHWPAIYRQPLAR